jgi:hypothetical protein
LNKLYSFAFSTTTTEVLKMVSLEEGKEILSLFLRGIRYQRIFQSVEVKEEKPRNIFHRIAVQGANSRTIEYIDQLEMSIKADLAEVQSAIEGTVKPKSIL